MSWKICGLLLAPLALAGCNCDSCGLWRDPQYRAQTSPGNVTNNLIAAYDRREIDQYAALLSDDFQFYFDEETRPVGIPIFWTRLEDSTATANLFRAGDVTDIRITLTYGVDVPVVQTGRESWRMIAITDTFLEVDRPPVGGGEVLTLRVDGDLHDYYFRKGRNPADTLSTSPTARLWYLVEWRDRGRTLDVATPGGPGEGGGVERTTWSSVKGLFR